MKCPVCNTKAMCLDSRDAIFDNNSARRRRYECAKNDCRHRFSTVEVREQDYRYLSFRDADAMDVLREIQTLVRHVPTAGKTRAETRRKP